MKKITKDSYLNSKQKICRIKCVDMVNSNDQRWNNFERGKKNLIRKDSKFMKIWENVRGMKYELLMRNLNGLKVRFWKDRVSIRKDWKTSKRKLGWETQCILRRWVGLKTLQSNKNIEIKWVIGKVNRSISQRCRKCKSLQSLNNPRSNKGLWQNKRNKLKIEKLKRKKLKEELKA